MSKDRKIVKMIVGLLTGYSRANIDLAEDVSCKFCKEEEETTVYMLCYCEGLTRTRFLVLGVEKSTAHS